MTHLNSVDIIIPAKNRTTIEQCVSTLRQSLSQADSIEIGNILVCDGGSQNSACLHQLEAIQQIPEVTVLSLHHEGFNKGWLLNQGLQAAKAPIVLISDVDILWSTAALETMTATVRHQPRQICCVHTMEESIPSDSSPPAFRYAYRVESTQDNRLVEIYPTAVDLSQRTGCGLVCARRSLFLQIGGYRHSFERWGWEDQDLLIRAELMGYQKVEKGKVTHLSHGDSLRNLSEGESIYDSRDRNICICLDGLAKGHLKGDLDHPLIEENSPPVDSKQPVQVRYVPIPASTVIES